MFDSDREQEASYLPTCTEVVAAFDDDGEGAMVNGDVEDSDGGGWGREGDW